MHRFDVAEVRGTEMQCYRAGFCDAIERAVELVVQLGLAFICLASCYRALVAIELWRSFVIHFVSIDCH